MQELSFEEQLEVNGGYNAKSYWTGVFIMAATVAADAVLPVASPAITSFGYGLATNFIYDGLK